MTRYNRVENAGRYAAQEARKNARAGDSEFARAEGRTRWQQALGADVLAHPLIALCHAHGLPLPVPEFRFHPLRKWRADYCFVERKVIVEIDGGAWTEGRHTRGAGFVADLEKLNAAALLGYHVLRYTPQQLGQAIADLKVMLAREAA